MAEGPLELWAYPRQLCLCEARGMAGAGAGGSGMQGAAWQTAAVAHGGQEGHCAWVKWGHSGLREAASRLCPEPQVHSHRAGSPPWGRTG